MISLKDYALEKLFINEAYNISYRIQDSSLEDAIKQSYEKLFNEVGENDKLKKLISYLYNNSKSDYPIIFSNNEKDSKKVKIQDVNWNIFLDYLKDNYNYDADLSKNYVNFEGIRFIQGNGTPKAKRGILLSTKQQENMTCKFINSFAFKSIEKIDDNIIFDNKNIFTDEEQKWLNDKSWRNTWIAQYNAIINFLMSENFELKDLTTVKAFRYEDKNDNISELITDVHNKLMKETNKSSKDIINPSDIFVYINTKTSINEITKALNSIQELFNNSKNPEKNSDTPILKLAQSKFKELYENHYLIGISLKKLNPNSEVKCDLLNYKGIDSYENLKLTNIIYDPLMYFLQPKKNNDNIITEFENLNEESSDVLTFLKKCEDNLTRQLTFELQYNNGYPKLICRTAGIKNTLGEKPSIAIMGAESSSAKAFNGRCEADYWKSLLSKYNPIINDIYDDNGNPRKELKYDVTTVVDTWDQIINSTNDDFNITLVDNNYNNYKNDLLKLFKLLVKNEKQLKCEVFVFYVQLNIIIALYNAYKHSTNIKEHNELIKTILLGCRKERKDALMYLYVHN